MAVNSKGLALNIVKTNAELKAQIALWKSDNHVIGFVPTMGSLHAGHIHLIDEAKKNCTRSVCSIFVNPTQFNEKADFERYPRMEEKDLEKLKKSTCDLVFIPSVEEIYEDLVDRIQKFDFGSKANVMEGKHRPGHFDGVGTVVNRLFDLVKPNIALFGLKDYQQYCIIRKLVEIQNLPIEIIGVPTVREQDGLAMSSRNALLEPLHRELAPIIYDAMIDAKNRIKNLPINSIKLLVEERLLALPDVGLDYVEIADSKTLAPVSSVSENTQAHIFIAAFFGKIRLIDNLQLN